MSTIKIEQIERPRADGLAGAHLEAPTDNGSGDGYALTVGGWAVGAGASVAEIELCLGEEVIQQLNVGRARADVASAYPDHPGADQAGFWGSVSTLSLPPSFRLRVRAVCHDGSRHLFAVIHGEQQSEALRAPADAPSPLLMITYGRTGSTWLTRLLGLHPRVLAYRPFEFEPRVISYWAQVLLALAEPDSYTQTLATALSSRRWWLGDSPARMLHRPDAALLDALGRSGIEDLAALAVRRITDTYDRVADVQRRDRPAAYLCEKVAPERPLINAIRHLYPEARCLYLVRDPRDMILSILAYNRRNGTVGFGREHAQSDDAFVEYVRRILEHMVRLQRADNPERSLVVRYEDIVTRPHEELGRIFRALDVELPSAEIAALLSTANVGVEDLTDHVTAPDVESSVHRWRSELDAERQESWTATLAEVLGDLGYDEQLVPG